MASFHITFSVSLKLSQTIQPPISINYKKKRIHIDRNHRFELYICRRSYQPATSVWCAFSSMRPHAAYINNMEVVNCLFNILVLFSLGDFTHNNIICINYYTLRSVSISCYVRFRFVRMAFWSFVYLFFGSVVEHRVQTMREYTIMNSLTALTRMKSCTVVMVDLFQ